MEAEQELAARSLKGQLGWLLGNAAALNDYRRAYISDIAAGELDYPIFFAVSERAGKNNSGEPLVAFDSDGKLKLDSHDHLVIDHDLDEIADEFLSFARARGFDFV